MIIICLSCLDDECLGANRIYQRVNRNEEYSYGLFWITPFSRSSIISESASSMVGGGVYLCIKLNFTELSLNRSQ